MALQVKFPEEFYDNWKKLRESLMGTPPSVMTGTDNLPGHIADSLSEMAYPKDPKDAFVGGVMGLPGYVSLPERMGIMRESPFFKQMLNGPGRGSSSFMGELNQGQNYAQSLRSLAETLGITDKNQLMRLLGNNAGR